MNTPADVDAAINDPFDDPRDRPEEAARRIRFGLLAFIASLAMLFGGSLFGYILIRLQAAADPVPGAVVKVPIPRGAIVMPHILWVSTALLLMAGVLIYIAGRAAKQGRAATLRKSMLAGWVLSFAFLACQAPGLFELYHQMRVLDLPFYGLTLTLIAIHALHVIGGLLPLTILALRNLREGLTFGDRISIQTCALYWHFLEIVWILMFGTFLILG